MLRMYNVLLAPHNANSSPGAWERVHWNTIRNLFVGLGLPPPHHEVGFGQQPGLGWADGGWRVKPEVRRRLVCWEESCGGSASPNQSVAERGA